MNKRQRLVQQAFLNNEEEVISRLQAIYGESLAGITKKVKVLDSSIAQLQKALGDITEDEIGGLALAVLKKKNLTPAEAQETIRSMIQAKVYQKQYQEALKKQVGGVLDKMGEKQYTTVSDYLQGCYQDGFIGTMYDLQGQGIPLCMPIDQQSMVRAVQLDSKISKGLYTRLGEDVTALKRKITAQISRGVASGLTYREMAQQLAGETRIGFNNAVRIARTGGHRIQCQAGMDACEKAREKGCDVLKQWDATLDGNTRESHSQVDGEIRELDKPFSNGLMFPGDPSGGAAEVINCRCALLQRASWELDEEELEELQKRAEYFGLDKTASFEEYREKYLRAAESYETPKEIVKNPLTNTEKNGKMLSEWDNSLAPRGQIYDKIPEDDLYSFVANEMQLSVDVATEYVDSVMAFTDADSEIYSEVRRFQRGNALQFMTQEEVKELSDNIETYIKKAPRWNGGTTFRGVSMADDELASFIQGATVRMGGTSSWSVKQGISRDFAVRNTSYERPNAVIYHCETQSRGTGIRHISVYEHEDEVLCSMESKYKVVRVETDDDHIIHIYLEEDNAQ